MKQKFKKRLKHSFPNEKKKSSPCVNCGKDGSHFVPPSLGEEGFFMCEKKMVSMSGLPIRDFDKESLDAFEQANPDVVRILHARVTPLPEPKIITMSTPSKRVL